MIDYDKVLHCHLDARERGALSTWTIYDHPRDYPNSFVMRRHEIGRGHTVASEDAFAGELGELRTMLARIGLVCMTRAESDDPKIVETWL
jgi:hypothetical protein